MIVHTHIETLPRDREPLRGLSLGTGNGLAAGLVEEKYMQNVRQTRRNEQTCDAHGVGIASTGYGIEQATYTKRVRRGERARQSARPWES